MLEAFEQLPARRRAGRRPAAGDGSRRRPSRASCARDKVAAQANAEQRRQQRARAGRAAWVRISGDDIPAGLAAAAVELLLTGTEVHARIRCGNRAMGYSLFYGVWEFLYEKVVFFF